MENKDLEHYRFQTTSVFTFWDFYIIYKDNFITWTIVCIVCQLTLSIIIDHLIFVRKEKETQWKAKTKQKKKKKPLNVHTLNSVIFECTWDIIDTTLVSPYSRLYNGDVIISEETI